MRVAFIEISLASSNPNAPSVGLDSLRSARALGHEIVVVTSDRAFYRGFPDPYVDRWIEADTTSAHAIADHLRSLRIDGVMSTSDLFVTVADQVARRLDLPNNAGAPAICRDKSLVRAALDTADVPNARWQLLDDPAATVRLPYPLIAKPVDGAASWDTRRIDDEADLRTAWDRHLARATYGRGVQPRHALLVEEVLDGPLVSVEGYVSDGNVDIWGHSDRELSPPPFYVELGSGFAADPLHPKLNDYATQVLSAAGYRHGAFHLEAILTENGPILVELNPRLIGGGAHQCIDAATGGKTTDYLVEALLGRHPRLPLVAGASYARDLVATDSGVIRSVAGIDVAAASPNIVGVVFTRKPGDHIAVNRSNSDALGYIISVGADRESAREAADRARQHISVTVTA